MATMAHQQYNFQFPSPATGHATNQSQQPYSLYQPSSQATSPTSSASVTPQGSSPTSPHTHHPAHSKQRNLMYVPAVLRPTQPPRRGKGASTSSASAQGFTPPDSTSSSLESGNGFAGFQSQGLKRSDTAASSQWSMETSYHGVSSGRPKNGPWKPDTQSTICDAPACSTQFGWAFSLSKPVRKHHCRRCGNIFCDACSFLPKNILVLDDDASFTTVDNGERYRGCDHCGNEYKAWLRATEDAKDRALAQDGVGGQQAQVRPAIEPTRKRMSRFDSIVGSLAGSLARDHNWSTF